VCQVLEAARIPTDKHINLLEVVMLLLSMSCDGLATTLRGAFEVGKWMSSWLVAVCQCGQNTTLAAAVHENQAITQYRGPTAAHHWHSVHHHE
jgi:hypothetical protein